MSFQCNGETTVFTTGSWQKKGGKMEFVETTVETSTNYDCLGEPSSSEQVRFDFYGDISLYSSYLKPCSVGDNVENKSDQSIESHEGLTTLDQPCISSNLPLDIMERLYQLETDVKSLQQENYRLKSAVADQESNLDEQLSYIYSLEKDLSRLDQYGRRENIEIIGIPSNVRDNELEREVLQILRKIGLDHLDHYAIVACHRIGKKDLYGNRNTIVRFLNRKDAIQALKCKRYLFRCKDIGYSKLQMVENLCPSYKSIYEEMKELKGKGVIEKVWTFNGFINYKINDNEQENIKKIIHESEMDTFYK